MNEFYSQPCKEISSPFDKDFDSFIACAEEGNITVAAEKLGIQQSGLSKIIQGLERDLGEKLFVRTARGVQLTEFGESIYRSIRKTQNFWSETFAKEIHDSKQLSGPLTIGCHSVIGIHLFPNILPKIRSHFPRVSLSTEMGSSLEITRKVTLLEVDIGFVINPVKSPDLVAKKLHREKIAIWKAPGKKEGRNLAYSPEMISNQSFLRKLRKYNTVPVPNYEVIGNLVSTSDWVGLLPDTVANRFKLEQVGKELQTVQLSMIWHSDRFRLPQQKKLLREIVKWMSL